MPSPTRPSSARPVQQVDAPDGASPYVLAGHQGEVTAVAWCPTDFHQACGGPAQSVVCALLRAAAACTAGALPRLAVESQSACNPPRPCQIATTADDATLRVWHIARQQPEEQANDGAARVPFQPWWQQAQQVRAAAAVAAAHEGVGQQVPLSATPGLPSSSAAAAAARAGTPWSMAGSLPGLGGSSSASMLAALRSQGPATGPTEADGGDENTHANEHRQQPGAAQASGSEQQQQGVAGPPATAISGRPASFLTPFVGAGGTGSPATARTAVTGGTGGRTVRRIGDLLNHRTPNTRRAQKQRSIASFLRSPAPGAAAAGEAAAAAGEAGPSTAALQGSTSRDLPAAAGTAAPPASGTKRSPKRSPLRSPLPGMGGSALPSPRTKFKRLVTKFEGITASRARTGAMVGAAAAAAAKLAGAAAALDPSPVSEQQQQQLGQGGKLELQRALSSAENALPNYS